MVKSQKQRRIQNDEDKKKERSNDTTASRGFSTEQRISIKAIGISRRRLLHQRSETRLVGLSIQEAAIGRQVESAENRALLHCPKYNAANKYWTRVDELLEDHAAVVGQIKDLSNSLLSDEKEESKDTQVSNFLQQPSPQPKNNTRSFTDMVGRSDEVVVIDVTDESITHEVKKERMTRAKKEESVSDDEVSEEV